MLNTWYEWLGLIVAVGTIAFGLGGVFLRVWQAVQGAVHFTDELQEIRKEFRPNGGGSLRDCVDRIEKAQASDHKLVVEHIAQDAAFQARVEPALLAQGR